MQAKIGVQWENFQEKQQKLSHGLLATQGKIQEIIGNANNCQKLPSALKELDVLWEAHNSTRTAKDSLTSEGKSLMAEDEKNVTTIQNILASIDANWDKVDNIIKNNRDKLSTLLVAVKKFNQLKKNVDNTMNATTQKHKPEDDVPSSLTHATIIYEKNKKCVEASKKGKSQLDQMEAKAQDIIKKSEHIEGFDVSEITRDLEHSQTAWQSYQNSLDKQLHDSEAGMVIWKHIDEAKNDLLQWLGDTNADLTDATENVVGSETGLACLTAYKNNLESKRNLYLSIISKTEQLQKILNGKSIPTLVSLKELLNEEFDVLAKLAKQLEVITDTFGKSEKTIKDDIKTAGDRISQIRETLIKCDNLTGENVKILERLKTCQGLKSELKDLSTNMDSINKSVEDLKSKFPSFSDSPIVKELSGLNKRYSSVMSHAKKVEKTLLAFLLKYHKEKLSALQRSIASYKEKCVWCRPESGSDKYNLEAKITTINDLESGLSDCEKKKMDLDGSLEMLLKVEGDVNSQELKGECDELEKALLALKGLITETKTDLDSILVLWKNYEQQSEKFSSWLKEIEAKVKVQGSAQTDIDTVPKKIKKMTKFKQDIEHKEPELKEVEKIGQEMSKQSSESRVGSYITQLASRYQTVKKFVDNYICRLQTLDKNNELYKEAVQKADAWISDANLTLTNLDEAVKSGSKPSLYQEKLDELKAFTVQREAGQVLLNKAVEQGEALFPEIIPANRDSVRTQLRNLRDSSEALIDKANAITKRIESVLIQRSSFDDSYSQVSQWINDIDKKIGDKVQLKSTLPDKKISLHTYRTLSQDINSHQAIFKQLQDKIAVLSDSEASKKFEDIMEEYKRVSKKVEDRVSASEKHVTNHESYVQALEKFRDFLNILIAEEEKSDKDGSASHLSVLEDLLLQKEEGDKLLEVCDKQLKTVVKQTAKSGHSFLVGELEEQKKNWTDFINRCNDSVNKLKQLSSKWTQFEEKLDQINNWLKQKESQVKDQSLKSTEEAKQQHLDKLKKLEDEILKKADEILCLNTEVAEAGPELVDKVSKLSARYQALKNQTKVSRARVNICY